MNYTCNDCRYYYRDDTYCTNIFYKKFPPTEPVCDEFELGIFKERFYVKAQPLVISTGNYYEVVDIEKELVDSDGDYLSFKYDDEAELLCCFLNMQYHRLHKLQLWVNEDYYENSIEKEYLQDHNSEVKE